MRFVFCIYGEPPDSYIQFTHVSTGIVLGV